MWQQLFDSMAASSSGSGLEFVLLARLRTPTCFCAKQAQTNAQEKTEKAKRNGRKLMAVLLIEGLEPWRQKKKRAGTLVALALGPNLASPRWRHVV
jgi:hypothetical protein